MNGKNPMLTHSLGEQLKQSIQKERPEMSMTHLVYDIESVVDKSLLNHILFAGESLSDDEAYARHIKEIEEKRGSTFVNASFHVPVCLAALAVDKDYNLIKLGLLGEDKRTPGNIVKHFWQLYNEHNFIPVDFNGRGYDMRLMELWAFRQGISIHYKHFDKFGPRYRYADDKHLDLHETLTNNLSIKLQGGLNYFAKILGLPGKMETKGDMVEELYRKGEMFQIEDYCLGDALDTYFIFLRWMLVRGGRLTLTQEAQLKEKAIQTTREYSQKTGYLKDYLTTIREWKPVA